MTKVITLSTSHYSGGHLYSVAMVAVGPKPVAGDTDAVLWHDHPTRVILKRHNNSSLGLSIITRQVSRVLEIMEPLCVCVCVCLCVCVCVHAYPCACVPVCMWCVCARVRVSVACMRVCSYMCMLACVHVFICVCLCMSVCICMYMSCWGALVLPPGSLSGPARCACVVRRHPRLPGYWKMTSTDIAFCFYICVCLCVCFCS